MTNNQDLFYKKTIPFAYEGKKLYFMVSQDLFSSHMIDHGTQRLLRTLSSEGLNKFEKALDLGCGYGPIGLSLKKINQFGVMHMVDTDALALAYSRRNAVLNKISKVKIYPSIGFDYAEDTDFDLIASNIPAKVGDRVLSHLLQDARFYLRPGGIVAIVVIEAISKYVARVLNANKDIEILFQKSWPGHLVFHYKFPSSSMPERPKRGAFLRGVYDRIDNKFFSSGHTLLVRTTYNLPEFDSLSYETRLLLDNLHLVAKGDVDKAVIYNPGQGYLPVALSQISQIGKIALVDRNLQALETSKRNLILNKFPAHKITLSHQLGILLKNTSQASCIIGIIPEKQSNEVYKMLVEQSAQQLLPGGLLAFASSSTVIKRLEGMIRLDKNLIILSTRRSKGKRVIVAKKR